MRQELATTRGLSNYDSMPNDELWGYCREYLKNHQNITSEVYERWIKPMSLAGIIDYQMADQIVRCLKVIVPSEYFGSYIEENLENEINDLLADLFHNELELLFSFPNQTPSKSVGIESEFVGEKGEENYVCPLKDSFRFETFYESAGNQMVRKIAEAVALSPKEDASSLVFIYGASGVGKTHLSQAMGQLIKDCYPDLKVAYVPAPRFELQYMIDARGQHSGKERFLSFYQNVDVFILDDIQSIMGKPKTLMAFFEIFNHLYLLRKQIILTSDVAPAQFVGLEERILTRLQSSLILELKRPDLDLRVKYLTELSKSRNIPITEDQILYVAKTLTRNMRELLGVMNYLEQIAKYKVASVLTMEVVNEAIKQVAGITPKEKPSISRIQSLVCQEFSVDIKLLQSKNRKAEVNIPRQILMYLAKKLTDLSYPSIAAHINRNHTTVMHGCKAVEDMMEANGELKERILRLEEMAVTPENA